MRLRLEFSLTGIDGTKFACASDSWYTFIRYCCLNSRMTGQGEDICGWYPSCTERNCAKILQNFLVQASIPKSFLPSSGLFVRKVCCTVSMLVTNVKPIGSSLEQSARESSPSRRMNHMCSIAHPMCVGKQCSGKPTLCRLPSEFDCCELSKSQMNETTISSLMMGVSHRMEGRANDPVSLPALSTANRYVFVEYYLRICFLRKNMAVMEIV